ncbi:MULTISPECIES: hypothetical protein [unclassified Microcoleus]|uniref:hypothetical protein n=1 Tax=unclassified Microcoleus TaxID=2642155 RepID=UPI0025F3B324|nr:MULTISPECIES: hypothetical protein [unclassified Microcoleus]
MNDITIAEMIAAIEDETLKAWWQQIGNLPEEFTVCEFFMKSLHACSTAAALKNESQEVGQKILGYPAATNGAVETTKSNQLFFRRTASINSLVVVDLDNSVPSNG